MVETIKDNDVFFKDGGERYKLSYEVYNNVTKNNIIEFSRIIPRMFLCSKRGKGVLNKLCQTEKKVIN